jgi:hypothetical protein
MRGKLDNIPSAAEAGGFLGILRHDYPSTSLGARSRALTMHAEDAELRYTEAGGARFRRRYTGGRSKRAPLREKFDPRGWRQRIGGWLAGQAISCSSGVLYFGADCCVLRRASLAPGLRAAFPS